MDQSFYLPAFSLPVKRESSPNVHTYFPNGMHVKYVKYPNQPGGYFGKVGVVTGHRGKQGATQVKFADMKMKVWVNARELEATPAPR